MTTKLSNPTISITYDRLDELYKAERKLQYLEAHGVDNWEGYSDVMEELSNYARD
jgi:hypothetical protein